MKLYIKNMVSVRCKMIVRAELEKLGVLIKSIELGEIETSGTVSKEKLKLLALALKPWKLELLDSPRAALIERIKSILIEAIYADELIQTNFSTYISDKMNYDYTYLSNTFSEVCGITIEHFIIMLKIERAKELLVYDELNINEIANKLHYSSSAHLSNQFKKTTGLTPSHFKSLRLRNS